MILHLDHVRKQYAGPVETVRATRDVSLMVNPGEIVVLFGPSGSGKSTLLMLAAGVLRPDAGRVVSHGRDLAGLSKKRLARRLREDVGIAFQNPHLHPGHTVLGNSAMKLFGARVSIADAQRLATPWLLKAGLGDRLDHYPHELSGGEKQRVGIARALTGDPSLLILDEPTASLDSQRGDEILDLIVKSTEQRTAVLLATHDRGAERIATRTIELQDGRLVEGRRAQAA